MPIYTATTDRMEPDRVWITYGGGCFHTIPDCRALADGQAKARAEGHMPWQVVSSSPAGARGRRACRICHAARPADSWSDTDDRILRIALAKDRPIGVIAGMLERTEDQVQARLQTLRTGEAT